jgi:hypothetical protein
MLVKRGRPKPKIARLTVPRLSNFQRMTDRQISVEESFYKAEQSMSISRCVEK